MTNAELVVSRIINCGCHSGANFPESPVVGMLFYRSDLQKLFVCVDAGYPLWTDDIFNSDQTGFETCFGSGESEGFVSIVSEDFGPVASFIYPGSSKWVPERMQVLADLDPSFDEGDDVVHVRLYDYTNSQIIAESTFLGAEEIVKTDMTPIFSNLPTGEAIFQVLMRLDPVASFTDMVRVHYFRIVKRPIVLGSGFGYSGGGITGGGDTLHIDRLDFLLDTISSITSTLTVSRHDGVGFASTTKGYFCGGNEDATRFSTIEKLTFSDESIAVNTSGLTTTKRDMVAGFESTGKGYICGGITTVALSTIDMLTFSNEQTGALTSGLTATRQDGAGGFASTTFGYACGGKENSGATVVSTITSLAFNTESTANISSGLSRTRGDGAGGFESSVRGYVGGGQSVNPAAIFFSTIDRLQFSNEAVSMIASNLTSTRHGGTGYASRKSGYFVAGSNTIISLNTVNKLVFSTESVSVVASAISAATLVPIGGFETVQ